MARKAVIFDLFGTLVDNLDFANYDTVLARMADVLGVPYDDFRQAWRDGMNERMTGKHGPSTVDDVIAACNLIWIAPTPDQIEGASSIRIEFTRQNLVPTADTLAALSELRKAGYPIGLITDCTSEVPMLWPATLLAPAIDHSVFSCREGMAKPDPRIYLLACERIGVSPKDCLYVGDGSSQELTGATEVGMRAVLIGSSHIDFAGVDRSDAQSWRGDAISTIAEVVPLILGRKC